MNMRVENWMTVETRMTVAAEPLMKLSILRDFIPKRESVRNRTKYLAKV